MQKEREKNDHSEITVPQQKSCPPHLFSLFICPDTWYNSRVSGYYDMMEVDADEIHNFGKKRP